MSKRSRNARRRMAQNTAAQNPAMASVQAAALNLADENGQHGMVLDTSLEGLPKQDIRIIELDKMFIDDYQRLLHSDEVEKIVKDFKPEKLGVLVVSERSDGRFAVIDGQHRMISLRRLGYKYAICVVVHGLSVQDEAYNFTHQRDNTKNLTARDRFKSSVIAGEEESTKINYILTKNGYSTEAGGQGARIEAVAALSKVAQLYSYEVLDQVLAFTNTTWPGDRKAVQREILVAFAEFVSRFNISNSEMQARFGEQSPDGLIRQIRQAINSATGASGKSIYGKQERFTACGILVNCYNKGFGSKSKKRLRLVWDASMVE